MSRIAEHLQSTRYKPAFVVTGFFLTFTTLKRRFIENIKYSALFSTLQPYLRFGFFNYDL
jgi:hypothetical protein